MAAKAANPQLIVSNLIVLLARQLLTWGLSSVLILFVPRYLGDAGLGQLTFGTSFSGMFVVLILLGVPMFLVKEIARDRTKISTYLINSLAMRVPLAIFAFALVFACLNLMDYPTQVRTVAYVACLTMIVSCFNDTAVSILRGLEYMAWPSMAEVAGKLAVTCVGVLALTSGYGVVAYAIVLLLGMTISLAINLSYFLLKADVKATLDLRVWRELLLGGWPYLLTAVLLTIYQRIDTTILRLLTTDEIVGWYGAATQIFAMLSFAPILVGTAILPAISRMYVADSDGVVRAANKSLAMTIVVSLPMGIGTLMTSDKIIKFLNYPEAFQNSVPLLAILAVSLPVTGVVMVMGMVAAAVDRQNQWARIMAFSLVVNVATSLTLIPLAQTAYGNAAIGAALATASSETAAMILGFRVLPARVCDKSLLVVTAKAAAGTAVMALIVYGLSSMPLFAVIAAAVLVYGAFIWATGVIQNSDIAIVRQALTRKGIAARSWPTASDRGV